MKLVFNVLARLMSRITPSSNWLQLQKQMRPNESPNHRRKRRKLDHNETHTTRSPSPAPSHSFHISEKYVASGASTHRDESTLNPLQKMVLGWVHLVEKQVQPGKYLALDCEMVGVGIDGEESSLARVSLVNFHGAVILDEFVKQRERVADYRTQYSGIRETDMIHAKPFQIVQKLVADLLKDRILVGHAIHNDFKVLLLSHPYPLTRDTQVLAHKSSLTKSKRIALRNLVKQELNLTIQEGEHSSVTDARATMAVYRLHKKDWDRLCGSLPAALRLNTSDPSHKKRKRTQSDDALDSHPESASGAQTMADRTSKPPPLGQGRKGVSSGLSTIVHHRGGKAVKEDPAKSQWWKQLPASKSSAKGSIKVARS